MDWEKVAIILELIRGSVRPAITIIGWLALVILASILTLRFANLEIALLLLGALLGSMATILGFWFKGRSNK